MKCLYLPVATAPASADALRAVLVQNNLLDSKYGPPLQRVLQLWQQEPPTRIDTVKRRRQKYTSKLVWEQTDVSVRINGHALPLTYRTICVEGSKPRELITSLEALQIAQRCGAHLLPALGCREHSTCKDKRAQQFGCISMGYPAFVCHLRATRCAETSANQSQGAPAPCCNGASPSLKHS